MNTRRLSSIAFASALGTLGIVLACCSGGTDGSGDEDFSGGQFIGTDSSSGSIQVNVLEPDMSVSTTSGFGVTVRNSLGNGVPGIQVSCDSESGVAILEPASGLEITDSTGSISGVIGCAAPGSYQFACRLPIGANKRQLVDIKCRGPIPSGFTGFTGASGGGLGGGSNTSDSGGVGGTETDGIRITNLSFDDAGAGLDVTDTNFSIDHTQDNCADPVGAGTPEPAPQPEPFFDTVLKVRVRNNSNQAIQFSTMSYTVSDFPTDGSTFTSDTVSFVGEASAIDGGGGEGILTMLAFNADNTEKYFVGNDTNPISGNDGFKSIEVTLNGTNDLGDDIQISGSVTLSFSNFNRCG